MAHERIALITGGVGDIGSGIAKHLSEHCHHVIALDCVSENHVASWQEQLKSEGFTNVLFRKLNVTDFDACHQVCESIAEEFGRIDILVNAAGITRDATLVKMSHENWDDVIHVNLSGVFNLTKHVVPHMLEKKYGRIVNISSVNGQKGQFGQCNYAAAKAGMHGFTKSLAQELVRKGITVNTVSPGYVNTQMVAKIKPEVLDTIVQSIPIKRLAEVEDIAWAIQFLTDERSGYITGANLSVNGGLHMY